MKRLFAASASKRGAGFYLDIGWLGFGGGIDQIARAVS